MGLRRSVRQRSGRDQLITVGLLAVAAAVQLLMPQADSRRALAREHLGDLSQRVDARGTPVYRAGNRAMLFFDARGAQGPIRGAVLVDGRRIEQVLLLSSREGLERDALDSAKLLDAFRDRSAERTVVVDVVTGATVSSRILITAVNRQLQRWRVFRVLDVPRGDQ